MNELKNPESITDGGHVLPDDGRGVDGGRIDVPDEVKQAIAQIIDGGRLDSAA